MIKLAVAERWYVVRHPRLAEKQRRAIEAAIEEAERG